MSSTVLLKGKEEEESLPGRLSARSLGRGRQSLSTGQKVTVLLDARSRCFDEEAPVPRGAPSPARLWPGRARLGLLVRWP